MNIGWEQVTGATFRLWVGVGWLVYVGGVHALGFVPDPTRLWVLA